MRDLDFVPVWYAAIDRKKQLLRLQLCVSVVVLLALGAFTYSQYQHLDARRSLLHARQAQLITSAERVKERQVLQSLREQLQRQEKVSYSLGFNVESSRVLELLDASLPAYASIIDLTIDTEEKARSLAQIAGTRKRPGDATAALLDRNLSIVVHGVAPSNGDIATLLEKLTASGYCQNVRLNYAKDRVDGERLMREFQVQFWISLNLDGGGA